MKVQNETQEQQFQEIGAILKQAREEKSIRIEELALQTRIRAIYLQALEDGKFEELPETIYVRGFVHRYADAVGLDGKGLAENFSNTFQKEEPKENIETIEPKANFTLPILSLIYIFLIVAASFGLFFILKPRPQAELSVRDRSSQAESSQSFLSKTTTSISNSNSNSSSNSSLSSSSKLASSPKNTSEPKPSPELPAKSTVKVSLKLQGRSWVEVQVDDQAVFKGFMKKGQNQSWTAKKELTVRAGDAAVVFLSKDDSEAKQMGAKGEVKQITFKPEAANDTISTPPQTLSIDS